MTRLVDGQMDGTQNIDKELQERYTRLGESILRVGRLEAENASLRTQLQALLQPIHDASCGDKPVPYLDHDTNVISANTNRSREISIEQFHALSRQYAELQTSHLRLQNQHSRCQRKIDEALQKARNHKNAAKEWKTYSERRGIHRAMLASAALRRGDDDGPPPEQRSAKEPADATSRPNTTSSAATSTDSARPRDGANEVSSALPYSPPRSRDRRVEGQAHGLRSGIPRITSSQTTTEDVQQQNVADPLVDCGSHSDSEPVVISSRSRKRKASTPATAESSRRRIKQEPGLDDAVMELNSEHTHHYQDTHELPRRIETPDLDATGVVVFTPRRPKPCEDLHQRATSEEAASLVPQLNKAISSLSDGAQTLMPISIKAEPVGTAHQNQDACPNHRLSHSSKPISDEQRGILRPINSNVPPLARSKEFPTKARSRAKISGARGKVLLLSEDGDDGSSLCPHTTNGTAEPSAVKEGPLEQMLNEPPPERRSNLRPLARTLGHQDRQAAAVAHLPTPVSAVNRTSPLKRPGVRKTPQGVEDSPPPIRPQEEPLRLRDVKSLRLQDFKINPKYMGTDYAFSDTLRGRDQRRALHTCITSDCCGGALQKVIEMGGTSLSGKSDAQALELYMGPNWRDLVTAHGPQQRKKTIMQAHAHCFANQYGKHRQAFARRNTPPGFWRTDFPTTQEVTNDREKAREMDRNAVEDRYREAMREGGRWKFRDE